MKKIITTTIVIAIAIALAPTAQASTFCDIKRNAVLWQCQTKPHRPSAWDLSPLFKSMFEPSVYRNAPDKGLGYYPKDWRRNAIGGGQTHARHGR
jgi:hypothetical protein